jgi:hypothetical protein
MAKLMYLESSDADEGAIASPQQIRPTEEACHGRVCMGGDPGV